ncbi:MAG: hypothetical protein AN484_22045 [Aphanizomenon flos-aquae WA102]|uniref:Uncharacterized protein n=1 Tax=Aphanizomenon flos-aquae WA102 TaxID=1710896 RepID=A0A1B7WUP2_APHFL|nr:MAG: hypothetical protein AN484_22045 [Aphanizomenon flos-aquae WA102]
MFRWRWRPFVIAGFGIGLGGQDHQHVKGKGSRPGALVDTLVFGLHRDVVTGRVGRGDEGRLDGGQVTHIAGQCGAAGTVIGEGRVVGVREQGDADRAAEVAFALGEVVRAAGGLAQDHGLGQGLDGGAVARQEGDGGQPGLGG